MSIQRNWLRGATSGFFATFCMSALMLLARKLAPTPKLPPRKILEAAVRGTPARGANATEIKLASTLAHFAFGAAAGALFGTAQTRLKGSKVVQGIGFGLLVWAVSYKGWIPALGILPQAEKDEPKRARTMVAAHVVYGAALGAAMRR
jgi:hypothetical protein